MVTKKIQLATLSLAAFAMAASVLSATSIAADKGLYLEGRAGASFAEDAKLDTTTNQDGELDTGWVGGVGLGYAYGNGVRGEIGFDYRQNDVDKVGGVNASGDMSAASLMISGFYDFFRDSKVQPYLGAGIGVAIVDADGISPVSGSSINDDDYGFAFQGMAGIAYKVSPRTKVTLGYRYFAVPDLSFRTAGGANVDSDYASHEIMIGVRFAFNVPKPAMPAPEPMAVAAPVPAPAPPPPQPAAAPAPAPAPAPAITRNFIVFFDWDRADITDLAENIIRSAASESERAGKVRLRLTGHADRSGARRYNQGLSLRRANAVRQRLQQLGIGANDIAVFAKGESEPLVATADGVREPQNRRVEIILE